MNPRKNLRTAARGLAPVALALPLVLSGMSSASAAATVPGGAFADAKGVIIDLTVLTAIPVPGAFGSSPLDPNTFSNASQSCPPEAAKPAADNLLSVPAAPAVTADAVSTMAGATCAADKEAGVASAVTTNVQALFNGVAPVITADVIRAQANSNCTTAPNATGSQFLGLKIAGQAIPLDVPPNTVIPLPGIGSVIINEQHPSASGRGIVVNGLHIIGASPLLRGDLIISHAVSGVTCANGNASAIAPGLKAPDITFDKDASPSTATPGTQVTYTATIKNTSAAPCDVLRFVDHFSPAFDLVSTSGDFGAVYDKPAPKRGDGGTDAILRPAALTIAAGATKTQTFVVTVKAGTAPGTYYNNLEIFCAVGGDFASGPLAPVTVPGAAPAPAIAPPVTVVDQPVPAASAMRGARQASAIALRSMPCAAH